MKKLFYFSVIGFVFFSCIVQSSKKEISNPLDLEIEKILENVDRDSSNKDCQNLMTEFYNGFESDEGRSNMMMHIYTMILIKYVADSTVVNRQLAVLLYNYTLAIDKPEEALVWIRALEKEYKSLYKQNHPLIYLYEGESLINNGQYEKAYKKFTEFYQKYPDSIVAQCYLYTTENDENHKKTLLEELKNNHPNHWIVKQLN